MPSFTITMSAADAARLSPALQDYMGLPEAATPSDAKALVISKLKTIVRAYERRQLEGQVSMPADVDLT